MGETPNQCKTLTLPPSTASRGRKPNTQMVALSFKAVCLPWPTELPSLALHSCTSSILQKEDRWVVPGNPLDITQQGVCRVWDHPGAAWYLPQSLPSPPFQTQVQNFQTSYSLCFIGRAKGLEEVTRRHRAEGSSRVSPVPSAGFSFWYHPVLTQTQAPRQLLRQVSPTAAWGQLGWLETCGTCL